MQLDFIDDDIRDHAPLDAQVYQRCGSDHTRDPLPLPLVLATIAQCGPHQVDEKLCNVTYATEILEKYSSNGDGNEDENLSKLLHWCWRQGTFQKIRRLKILRLAPVGQAWWQNKRFLINEGLDKAYHKPFIGNTANDFIGFLIQTDQDIRFKNLPVYAKAISVIQSSGTGKSRMLTEAGNQIFTLPICLRDPRSPGYPPSDEKVFEYFMQVSDGNDMSYTAHRDVACFLAAAHQTMLKWLKELQQREMLDGKQLHRRWYWIMERKEGREQRCRFFSEVLEQANAMKLTVEAMEKSPRPDDPDCRNDRRIEEKSESLYAKARTAVQDLMTFLADLHPGPPLCVTYFDEAHELGTRFWVLLRLLNNQHVDTKMWYIFMGTKSSIFFFAPPRGMLNSLRLQNEIQELLGPYIALDFDQNIRPVQQEVTVKISHLQSLEHLASYGRPLWKAQLPYLQPIDMARLAASKLTNAEVFNDQNKDHVFAVFSQRFCLEPVLVGSEAVQLADRSVFHHMRLITGISGDRRAFYTYSPSEPILVLGAANILYNTNDGQRWARVLDTFSKQLCSAGLVEKGLTGELGARVLLLLARDFVAPVEVQHSSEGEHSLNRNLLKPVCLLDMLDVLFGNTTWAGTNRGIYNKAFKTAHVNFTHWIVTRDPLPETPDQDLLANLWARGAILQCCFNQVSIDFLMVVYHGDIQADSVFDPAMLSGVFGQVKFKNQANTNEVEQNIRPIGLPRDLSRPLPYLALLLELGNESTHQTTHTKIKVTIPAPASQGEFQKLKDNWVAAEKLVESHQRIPGNSRSDPELTRKQKAAKEKRLAKDAYNRYSIAVRGALADVYGILHTANIEAAFATLLSITMPSPTAQDETIQHMQPFERLGWNSGHTAWMSKYVVGKSEEQLMMDVDNI